MFSQIQRHPGQEAETGEGEAGAGAGVDRGQPQQRGHPGPGHGLQASQAAQADRVICVISDQYVYRNVL